MPKKDNTGVSGDDDLDLESEEEGDGDADGAAGQSDESKRTVPLKMAKALRRENQDLKTRLARLEGRVEESSRHQRNTPAPQTVTPKPVEYSRAQLDAAVTAGTITETTRDEILQRQSEARNALKIKEATDEVRREVRVETKVETQLNAYVADNPDIMVQGSDLRAKVQAAFDELVELGDDPKSLSTQLKAVKMTLPAIAPKIGRRKEAEVHEEGDSGADSEGDGAPKDKSWSKGLTKRQVQFYESNLTKGIYKGVKDKAFLADINSAKQRLRASH